MRRIVFAAACAGIALVAVGAATGAPSTGTVATGSSCGVTQNCIRYTNTVVGAPLDYVNFHIAVCESSPTCDTPDVSANYADGERDVDAELDANASYYLVVSQASGTDPARLGNYRTTIACSSGGKPAGAPAGPRTYQIDIPSSTNTMVDCTVTNTFKGPSCTHSGALGTRATKTCGSSATRRTRGAPTRR